MPKVVKVVADNTLVDWAPVLKHNNTSIDCANARVTFSIPTGVRLVGPTAENSSIIIVPKGFYNSTDKIWYIGTLIKGETINAPFVFIVDDITQANPLDNRFLITAVLTSVCNETNTVNNTDTLVIEIADPCTQISLTIGVNEESSDINLSIG